MLNKNYAIFTMVTDKYKQHLITQMQSIFEYAPSDITLNFHILYNPEEFVLCNTIRNLICRIQTKSRIFISLHTVVRNEFNEYTTIKHMNSTEFNKRARFFKINQLLHGKKELWKDYDAVCMLDADMFIVSEQFFDLFDLVNSTDKIIVCNEKFKWETGNYFLPINKSGEENHIFKQKSKKLFKMHCSVPIFLNPGKKTSEKMFVAYLQFANDGYQIKGGNCAGIGDIYCWNLMIKYLYLEDKIISFPMETMTQVHQTNLNHNTHLIEDDGYWYTMAGDQVFCLHGRVNEKNFIEGGVNRAIKDHPYYTEKQISDIKKSLTKIQNKWYTLNKEGQK